METLRFFVLIGNTGSGKTRILQHLTQQNVQTLDLEAIAKNSGSVFGRHAIHHRAITQKQFRDALLLKLSLFDPKLPIVTEWKGKKLGGLKIPDTLYSQCITAPKIAIERAKTARVEELKMMYSTVTIEQLYKSLFTLKSKFSETHFKTALEALRTKNKTAFVNCMLAYYDETLEYKISHQNIQHTVQWKNESIEDISLEVKRLFL